MNYDGLTPADLAARLGSPDCLVLARVTSTMDIVHSLAAEGAPAGTVVLAEEQVAGRGRQGRHWHSPAGKGIWLGYLLRPRAQAAGGVLALRVGLAVASALRDLGAAPSLKWPNDILLGSRKAAGILCEARGWVAVGVGMNVHGPLPPEVREHAVALDQVVPRASRVAVLERLVPRLHQVGEAPVLSADERAAYQAQDWLAGRQLLEPVRGRAVGVDLDGALLVETPLGRERVVAGSVVAV